jgi:hypothetical protein
MCSWATVHEADAGPCYRARSFGRDIGAGGSFQAALLFALRAIGQIKSESLAQMNADERA